MRLPAVALASFVLAQASASGRERIRTVTNAKYGITFAVPSGWTIQVNSSYQVTARGPDGGLETHAVILSKPERAIRDFFVVSGEGGDLHTRAGWTCASSRSWRPNPVMEVVACAEQLKNGHSILVSLIGRKEWIHRVGGESFLRSLVAKMRGFRAEDD